MAEASYKTKQRETIIDCLKNNSERSMTAEEISDKLKESDICVGKATIYRCLDMLVSEGCVRKYINHRGTSAGYQYVEHSEGCAHHFHLKCIECGALIHLGCDYMKDIDKHILEHHGFTVDNSRTVLYGICKECSKRANRKV